MKLVVITVTVLTKLYFNKILICNLKLIKVHNYIKMLFIIINKKKKNQFFIFLLRVLFICRSPKKAQKNNLHTKILLLKNLYFSSLRKIILSILDTSILQLVVK